MQPKIGRLALWMSLDSEGIEDPHAVHAGLRVEEGFKSVVHISLYTPIISPAHAARCFDAWSLAA